MQAPCLFLPAGPLVHVNYHLAPATQCEAAVAKRLLRSFHSNELQQSRFTSFMRKREPPTQIKEEEDTARQEKARKGVQTIEQNSYLAEKLSLVATPRSLALASVSLFDSLSAWQGSGSRTNGKASNSFGLCLLTENAPPISFKRSTPWCPSSKVNASSKVQVAQANGKELQSELQIS